MEGDLNTIDGLISENSGIIPRTLFNLFRDLKAEDKEFSIKMSYIELCNEDFKDLLSYDDSQKLKILDDRTLIGYEEVLITNAANGIQVFKQGSN